MASRKSLLTALADSADRDIQIASLFGKEPDRLSRFVMREGPLRADFSKQALDKKGFCLLYTSPSPRDATLSRMPSSA